MLTAITKNGSLVSAQDVRNGHIKEERFYCPECKEIVILKNGLFKKSHFAHKPHSQCFESYENESEVHLKGKLLLYEWLQKHYTNVQIEKYFPSIDQRADLSFVHNGAMYVIEFQCSKIPTKLIQKRTNGYIKVGIKPLWILSHRLLQIIGNHLFSLTAFHFSLLQQTSTKQFIIPFLNVDTQSLYILYHPLPITSKKTFALLSISTFESKSLYELLNPGIERISFSFWWKERESLKQYGNLKYSSFSRRFKDELYRSGYYIEGLPDFCGLPVKGSVKLITNPIQWQTFIFLDVLQKEQAFHMGDVYDSVQYRLDRNDIRIREDVPISLKEVIATYLRILCIIKVVEEVDDDCYKMCTNNVQKKKINKEEGEYIMKIALSGI